MTLKAAYQRLYDRLKNLPAFREAEQLRDAPDPAPPRDPLK